MHYFTLSITVYSMRICSLRLQLVDDKGSWKDTKRINKKQKIQ